MQCPSFSTLATHYIWGEKKRCCRCLQTRSGFLSFPEAIRPSWFTEKGVNSPKGARSSIKLLTWTQVPPLSLHPDAVGKEEGPRVGGSVGQLLPEPLLVRPWTVLQSIDTAQTEPPLTLFMAIRVVYLVFLFPYIPCISDIKPLWNMQSERFNKRPSSFRLWWLSVIPL